MVDSEAYKFLGFLQLEVIRLFDGHQQGKRDKFVCCALVDIQFRVLKWTKTDLKALQQTVRVAFTKHRMRFPKCKFHSESHPATYSRRKGRHQYAKTIFFPDPAVAKILRLTFSWIATSKLSNYRIMHEPPSTRVGINRQTSVEYVVGCGWTLLSNRRNNTGHPGPNNCGEELSARKRGDTLQEVQFCGRDDLPMLNQRSP